MFVKEYSERRMGFIVTVSPDAASAEVFLKENSLNRPFHYIMRLLKVTGDIDYNDEKSVRKGKKKVRKIEIFRLFRPNVMKMEKKD
ncbi:MAG: hypothetical protein OCU22_09480 [Canidatus Methanoxibalbensis ujae]|nr:hypothetical protein [Candidatus Methanoxibalbensis ujae]